MRAGKSLLAACAAGVVAAVGGCGGDKQTASAGPNVVQAGAPGEPSRQVAPGATPAPIQHTPADVAFMQGMIHHHQQAIVITDWVPGRTESTSVRVMARRMAISQENEMGTMRKWLEARGVDPADHSHAHTAMPGMLDSRQLKRLKAADGREFDRLFLRSMTQHHQGALTMVQELLDEGGGAEAEIGQFTRHVDADQGIEIQRMRQMLSAL